LEGSFATSGAEKFRFGLEVQVDFIEDFRVRFYQDRNVPLFLTSSFFDCRKLNIEPVALVGRSEFIPNLFIGLHFRQKPSDGS
jgi:hypothetical protein